MNESREELERLARRLCEAAGWELFALGDNGAIWVIGSQDSGRRFFAQYDWLPLARIVVERDRLREAIGRVEALADWWTEEMHRAKDQRQLAIAPEEILIEQRIDQLRAALEGK